MYSILKIDFQALTYVFTFLAIAFFAYGIQVRKTRFAVTRAHLKEIRAIRNYQSMRSAHNLERLTNKSFKVANNWEASIEAEEMIEILKFHRDSMHQTHEIPRSRLSFDSNSEIAVIMAIDEKQYLEKPIHSGNRPNRHFELLLEIESNYTCMLTS